MAFCKYCGAQLEEGQSCVCPQAQAARQAQENPQPQPNPDPQPQEAAQGQSAQASQAAQAAQAAAAAGAAQAAAAARSVKPYLTEYLASPAQAVRKVMEQNNMTMAITLTVIRALAVGLAIYGFLSKICASATKLVTGMMGYFDSSAGAAVKAPFLGSLLYGALIALIGMALVVLMLFAMVRLFHGTTGIKSVFQASAANGVVTSALFLLAFLGGLISIKAGLFFLVCACISWVVNGVLTAQILCGENSESGKFWLFYLVGVVLVFAVGLFIIPKLMNGVLGGISVTSMGVTVTLKDAMGSFASEWADLGGWSGLFDQILEEFTDALLY